MHDKTCTCEAAKGRYSTHLKTCPAVGTPVIREG